MIEISLSASYLDCYHTLIVENGTLVSRLYDRRDDFNFPTVKFPFSSIIPSGPALWSLQCACFLTYFRYNNLSRSIVMLSNT